MVEQDYRLLKSAELLQNPPAEHVRIIPRENEAINFPSQMDESLKKEVGILIALITLVLYIIKRFPVLKATRFTGIKRL